MMEITVYGKVRLFTYILILLSGLSLSSKSQQRKYFVNADGHSDTKPGLSFSIISFNELSNRRFGAGDTIVFESGKQYSGTIFLQKEDGGHFNNPLVITSSGKEKAIIAAGDSSGILISNVSNLVVNNLEIRGNGVGRNFANGILIHSSDTLTSPENIRIMECDVRGFHKYGIALSAEADLKYKGYKLVRISNCNTSENGEAGIGSFGSYLGFQHRNVIIRNCKAFNNRGIPTKKENHSGNGIVMGMVDSLLIENCEAWENGADNRCTKGGPVGIWVWMCRNAIIQHCISRQNRAGLNKDGGGFDIDGGSSQCIMQYNLSYDNEGAGYLLAEYGAEFPFTDNVVRFNVSVNDGRKNSYGSISIWGADSAHAVRNTYIYNNTIYTDDKKSSNGIPAAITYFDIHFKNVVFANNIFLVSGNTRLINADSLPPEGAVKFIHNNYYSYSNTYQIRFGNKIEESISAWLNLDQKQEIWGGEKVYLNINPGFTTPSTNKTPDGNSFTLSNNSRLHNKLFDVGTIVSSNTSDFIRKTIDSGLLPPGKKSFTK